MVLGFISLAKANTFYPRISCSLDFKFDAKMRIVCSKHVEVQTFWSISRWYGRVMSALQAWFGGVISEAQ